MDGRRRNQHQSTGRREAQRLSVPTWLTRPGRTRVSAHHVQGRLPCGKRAVPWRRHGDQAAPLRYGSRSMPLAPQGPAISRIRAALTQKRRQETLAAPDAPQLLRDHATAVPSPRRDQAPPETPAHLRTRAKEPNARRRLVRCPESKRLRSPHHAKTVVDITEVRLVPHVGGAADQRGAVVPGAAPHHTRGARRGSCGSTGVKALSAYAAHQSAHHFQTLLCMSHRPQGLNVLVPTGCVVSPELPSYQTYSPSASSLLPTLQRVVVPARHAYSHPASVGRRYSILSHALNRRQNSIAACHERLSTSRLS